MRIDCYIFGEQVNNKEITIYTSGAIQSENRYMPWGEVRYSLGRMPTDYTYTGQKDASEIGLMFYNARWYDPAIAHFTQADTLIPGAGSPQAWDRYAYVFNNPLKFTDPSGNWLSGDNYDIGGAENLNEGYDFYLMATPYKNHLSQWKYRMDLGEKVVSHLNNYFGNDKFNVPWIQAMFDDGASSMDVILHLTFRKETSSAWLLGNPGSYGYDEYSDAFLNQYNWFTDNFGNVGLRILLGSMESLTRLLPLGSDTLNDDFMKMESSEYFFRAEEAIQNAMKGDNYQYSPEMNFSWGNTTDKDRFYATFQTDIANNKIIDYTFNSESGGLKWAYINPAGPISYIISFSDWFGLR